jgi:microcystin-dependent protein
MAQPYVGEIRMFGGTFAPQGWMFCSGQLLPISENETLFQLIGTTYGGDGQSTFALPDLQSRAPIHQGNGYILAETDGSEMVTLTTQQMPLHTHPFIAANVPGDQITPGGNLLASQGGFSELYNGDVDGNMNAGAVLPAGGSQPHENLQPLLVISFIISLFGIFPSQS